jgi:hypothetical protein
MGQYGAMQVVSIIFLEYHVISLCPAYSHNPLRVHDAAGENKIFKKIKELGRIQGRRGQSPILLIVTAVSNMIPLT